MNFSKNDLRKALVKVFTWLNFFSFLLFLVATDYPFIWNLVWMFNLGWLFLVAYANGYVYNTKLYFRRIRHEKMQSRNFNK